MRFMFKWVEAYCPHCRARHTDLAEYSTRTVNHHGGPKLVRFICNRCQEARYGKAAFARYAAWREACRANAAPLGSNPTGQEGV